MGGSGLAGGADGINTVASVRLAIANDSRRARLAVLEAADTADPSATVLGPEQRRYTGERRVGGGGGSPYMGLTAGTRETPTLDAATGTRNGFQWQGVDHDCDDHTRGRQHDRSRPVTVHGSGVGPADNSCRHRQEIRRGDESGSLSIQRSAKEKDEQQQHFPLHDCRAGRPATRWVVGGGWWEFRRSSVFCCAFEGWGRQG